MFSVLSYIIGHAYRWLVYLFIFLVLDQVFAMVSAWMELEHLQTLIIYMLNTGVFPLFPENAIVTILNAFIFMLTIDILFDVLGYANIPGKPAAHSSGFASKAV